ncbi:MAG: agmatine deiminase family protein [Nocardioidaceae bacterium]|nr:agmatine deiminase family protein [Nocardioidaceae bacterium]
MPAETSAHTRTWMAWPSAGYTLGDTAADAEEARATWAAVAHAVLELEPVSMVVDPSAVDVARARLSAEVELHVAPLDDAWMRDIGPTFVVGDDGRLGAVDWVFNGWGRQDWARWEHDAAIGRQVAQWAGAELVTSPMVNEGGAIHVDGRGTVLVTQTVQLDERRNPGWSREDVEAELARTLGASDVIWVPRGLTRDYDTFGTRGHVDIVACLPSPGVALVHDQEDASHPDHAVSAEVRAVLAEHVDVVALPAPAVLRDEEGPVDYSYVNHLVADGGVVACTFDDPHDDRALGILADAYPGRRVIGVDARPLFARGGGIHCITQQQPAV